MTLDKGRERLQLTGTTNIHGIRASDDKKL